jgi:hypothetical protein
MAIQQLAGSVQDWVPFKDTMGAAVTWLATLLNILGIQEVYNASELHSANEVVCRDLRLKDSSERSKRP